MKTTITITIDPNILEAFDKTTGNGKRSSIIEELMKEYLSTNFPTNNISDLTASKENEISDLLERIESLKAVVDKEKERADREYQQKEDARLFLIEKRNREALSDECRFKAKQLTRVSYGLEPLGDFLPSDWKQVKKDDFRRDWERLTAELIEKGEKE